ncbi:MAG: hypothetical protein KatS3mg131_2501 [Candidatus Tectimicrobiota bacterium]|nr:MAG: hypothetical protein KatS3mg131_2501 [Candidatus Tectomicrobia bacterium]
MQATDDLIVLTYADYLRLRRELKEAGLDLCYMAQAGRPIRLDWSPDLFSDAKFRQELAARRPPDPCYRIVSVWLARKGNWLRPDEFTVTFHAVSPIHDAALEKYLAEHQVRSSAEATWEKLLKG